MKREILEQKMTELLDSGFSEKQEKALMKQLEPFPDLKADWQMLRTGIADEQVMQSAWPLHKPEKAKLDPILSALNEQRFNRKLGRFTGYLAAAAVMVIAFTGVYLSSSGDSSYTAEQIADWIYVQDQQEAFYNEQYLLVDQFIFTTEEIYRENHD